VKIFDDPDKTQAEEAEGKSCRGTPITTPNNSRRREIDLDQVQKLAAIQCTLEEIALIVGCSVNLLRARPDIKAALDKGRAEGRISLRKKQFESAMRGNVVAMIWLGKQILGQKDKVEDNAQMSEEDLRQKIMLDLREMIDSVPVTLALPDVEPPVTVTAKAKVGPPQYDEEEDGNEQC
jgi:hypothetical protein